MKTKTIIIILVVVIVLAAAVWIFAGKKTTTQEPAADPSVKDTGNSASSNGSSTPVQKMPLVQGAKGELVRALQTALNNKYKAGLTVDGDWGARTEAALKSNNLPTTIYWKQWSEITGLSLNTGAKLTGTTIGVFTAENAKNWWNYLTTW